MRARLVFFVCLLLPFGATGPLPATEPPSLEFAGQARVVAVIDGDTVVLDDGRQVRLVGIQEDVGSTLISYPKSLNSLGVIWVGFPGLLFCLG